MNNLTKIPLLHSKNYNRYLVIICSIGVIEDELSCPIQKQQMKVKYETDCATQNFSPKVSILLDIDQNFAHKNKIRNFFHVTQAGLLSNLIQQESDRTNLLNSLDKTSQNKPDLDYLASRCEKSYVEIALQSLRYRKKRLC